ncbi:Spc7-domain-containing protein [Xylariomycetidae sp. FL0641]|nr:Spc7-domain-containing protein [Xylariomycetidae sp. FL0641]
MSSRGDLTMPSTRRPRKSTGHSPVRKRMEKENITVDVASSLAGNGGRKKSRSKSMGPGGLDVLKSGSGNRRVSLAAPIRPPPRSILKPTIPILPEIPPHKPKSSARKSTPSIEVQGSENLPNPFHTDDASSGTKIALRTEEQQQAAAREREERERRQLEKEINDRREARRKSLANRRVSFAAEATLHTFHEVEYMQDSTTSTESTRRASSVAGQASAAAAEPSDPPSTPPEQVEDVVPNSPEHQRDLHQKKRRRSSGASTMSFISPGDETMASSIYSSDSEAADGVIEAQEMDSDSGSDSDADEVSVDLDVDEVTGTSVASAMSAMSARSAFSEISNDTLDEVLRQATRRAETQQIDEEEEIIPSFGWVKKPQAKPESPNKESPKQNAPDYGNEVDNEGTEMDMEMDMDMTNAVGGIFQSKDAPNDTSEDEGMSMDVTKALGGILPQRTKPAGGQQKSPGKLTEEPTTEDATMELTRSIGGIQEAPQDKNDFSEPEDNEDMSMELTSVVGGFMGKSNATIRRASVGRRRTMTGEDEATMDMTVGMGQILPADQIDDNESEATMGMDMTVSMGGIIGGPSPAKERTEAKHLMEEEVDKTDGTPVLTSPFKKSLPKPSEDASPSIAQSPGISAFRGNGLRRSSVGGPAKGKSPIRNTSSRKSVSPEKPGTPSTPLDSSPLKTPDSRPSRSASPKKPGSANAITTPGSAGRKSLRTSLFSRDNLGVSTPQVVLTPQPRRLSGIGADRPGLGSPKVAAIFDRRGSIGESATSFTPRENCKAVSFADPRAIEDELDAERQAEEDKENQRKILEREANGGDDDNTTATLKDMISSMTPKKNPLRGRKSLHVGSASGLLGKRPAELDEDEDSEDRDGIKRLKGHQGSPVKNVRLHAPPTKEETTGRMSRAASRSLDDSTDATPSSRLSPKKGSRTAPSPHGQGRFKDIESDQPTHAVNFDEAPAMANPEAVGDDTGDRIHLQDFLNLTSIRFMELTTTKRRHTQAPQTQKDLLGGKEDLSLERCVVAGACTVPMLELYQHSCRELKNYISEGRRIVREIEMETLEENPPLFREYMTATPEFKILMDNQFKNVKTHARLLSKAMWYEWRMKLQDGLKEGLIHIAEGMTDDEELMRKQQELLDSAVPELTKRLKSLTTEREQLESVAEELADCDPEDLQSARTELTEVDADIQVKMENIEALRQQLQETESSLDEMSQRKQACLGEINAAEKVREECRGWSSTEINSLKAKVEALEKQHGWAITGIADTTISMTYQREIELVLDVAAFQGDQPITDSRVDLRYVANRDSDSAPALPEKEFFVQCIRDHVRGLARSSSSRSRPTVRQILHAVADAWAKAAHVADNLRLLNTTFPTKIARTGEDNALAVSATLLLAPMQTKVQVALALHAHSAGLDLQVEVTPHARVVYGEHFKTDKVEEYLATRIGSSVVTRQENPQVESWSDVLVELHGRLLARGRK